MEKARVHFQNKVVALFMYAQLTDYLRNFHLQNEDFKPQKSTEDILLHMNDCWGKVLNDGRRLVSSSWTSKKPLIVFQRVF